MNFTSSNQTNVGFVVGQRGIVTSPLLFGQLVDWTKISHLSAK